MLTFWDEESEFFFFLTFWDRGSILNLFIKGCLRVGRRGEGFDGNEKGNESRFLRGVEGKVYGECFSGLFESIIDKEMIWFLKLSTTL